MERDQTEHQNKYEEFRTTSEQVDDICERFDREYFRILSSVLERERQRAKDNGEY